MLLVRRRRHAEVHVARRRRPRLLLLLVILLVLLLLLEGGRAELLLVLGGQRREARPLLFPLLHLVLLMHLRSRHRVCFDVNDSSREESSTRHATHGESMLRMDCSQQ